MEESQPFSMQNSKDQLIPRPTRLGKNSKLLCCLRKGDEKKEMYFFCILIYQRIGRAPYEVYIGVSPIQVRTRLTISLVHNRA
jgi:hypothetical protein